MNQKFRIRQGENTYLFESINEAAADTLNGGLIDYENAEFFTGLTDIYGVEIFEGDILEYEDRWKKGAWYAFGTVEFGKCSTDMQGSVEDSEAICFHAGGIALDPIYRHRVIGKEGE